MLLIKFTFQTPHGEKTDHPPL